MIRNQLTRCKAVIRNLTYTYLLCGIFLASGCQMVGLPAFSGFGWQSQTTVESMPIDLVNRKGIYIDQARIGGRALILACGADIGDEAVHGTFVRELAEQLRQRNVQQTLAPEGVSLRSNIDAILEGNFSEREIARLGNQYDVGTLMVVKVHHFRDSQPLRVGISIVCIDVDQSVVYASVSQVWELADPVTNAQFENYLIKQAFRDYEVELLKQSPNHFLQFVAAGTIEGMVSEGY